MRKRITRRAIVGAGAAGIAAPAWARIFSRPGGGAIPAGGSVLTTNTTATRPFSSLANGINEAYPVSYVNAIISGSPGLAADHLMWWSSPTGYVGNPIYVNGTGTGMGVTAATLINIPSVSALDWNSTWGAGTINPVTTSWELRLISGGVPVAGAVVAFSIDILKRSNPYWPTITQYLLSGNNQPLFPKINSGSLGGGDGGNYPAVVAGTVGFVIVTSITSGAPNPPVNSLVLQYTLNDIVLGAPVPGPSMGDPAFRSWGLTVNTTSVSYNGGTGIPDGTYSLGVRVVDYPTGTFATKDLPFFWQCLPAQIIVKNTAFITAPQVIPLVDVDSGPNFRFNSPLTDFVTIPALSSLPFHATSVPIPSPQSGIIPPVTSASSPFFGNATALLNSQNFYVETYTGRIATEYAKQNRLFTTLLGGTFAFQQEQEIGQGDIVRVYLQSITHQNWSGSRNDCMSSMATTVIEGIDSANGTPSLRSFWLCMEQSGTLRRLDYTGKTTTLAGLDFNRTLLPYPDLNMDSSITEAQIDTRFNHIGTIGSPSFGDLRGMNDAAYDPTDATGNTLFIAKTTDHFIVKATNLLSGSPTLIRFAGQDGGLGGLETGAGTNGGFQDGVATEFTAGSSVATFNGTVTGNVLTVNSGLSGTISPGCPLSWSGNPNTTTGNMVTTNIAGGSSNGSTWNTNFASSGGAQSMTASTQVALFNQPYSVAIDDGTGGGTAGDMYVADYANHRLRLIRGGIVTTLFGNQANVVSTAGSPGYNADGSGAQTFGPFNITALSWAGGLLSVTVSAPITKGVADGFSQTYNIAPFWTVDVDSTGNVNIDGTCWPVSTVTDAQHFTLSVPSNPGALVATGTITPYYTDIYGPTNPTAVSWSHGAANERYMMAPARLIWSSANPGTSGSANKHLVVGTFWTIAAWDVDIAPQTVRCITTLYADASPGSRKSFQGSTQKGRYPANASWFQIDVDSAGTIGVKNDIVMMNGGASLNDNFWKGHWDSSNGVPFGTQNTNQAAPLPFSTNTGAGHYPWTIGISRTQGRLVTSGSADKGLQGWRIKNTASYDIDANSATGLNFDTQAATRALSIYCQGSIQNWNESPQQPGIFPWGVRPPLWLLHGSPCGQNFIGLTGDPVATPGASNTDSFDALVATYPDDTNMALFIQGGMGGAIPRPELTGDDLADFIYWIRRSSLHGSFTAPLVQRVPYAGDTTAPTITSISAARAVVNPTTSITVTFTTSKATYACVAVGYASAHGTPTPYHVFKMEPWTPASGISAAYITSHSVTMTGLVASVTVYVRVTAKDMAGNNVVSAEQTVT